MSSAQTELVFLGTGTSHGVPMIGCDCAVCRSRDPRDRRNRASVVVRAPGGTLLIDAAPELRLSAVACGIARVDAILVTHAHADHIMGLDDVRRFNDAVGGTIPAYANDETVARLRSVFAYAEAAYQSPETYRPSLAFRAIHGPTRVCGLEVVPVPLKHGADDVLGFRLGALAYCTDCSEVPPSSEALLGGLDLLVLDALRHRPHPTHFSLAQALEVIGRLRPRRALLTHMTHELPHEATNAALPEHVRLAYDGLAVTVPGP